MGGIFSSHRRPYYYQDNSDVVVMQRQRHARKRDSFRSSHLTSVLLRRIRRIQISEYLNNENMRKTYYITIALAFVTINSSTYFFLSCAPSFFLLLFSPPLSTPCLCPCLCQNMTAGRFQRSPLGLYIRPFFSQTIDFFDSGSFDVVFIPRLRCPMRDSRVMRFCLMVSATT